MNWGFLFKWTIKSEIFWRKTNVMNKKCISIVIVDRCNIFSARWFAYRFSWLIASLSYLRRHVRKGKILLDWTEFPSMRWKNWLNMENIWWISGILMKWNKSNSFSNLFFIKWFSILKRRRLKYWNTGP
jgi:hypothetical protein